MTRIELERSLAVAERRIQLSPCVARAAAVAPGIGQARVEPDGLGVIGQRGVNIAKLLARRPANVPCAIVARIEFDGAAEVGDPGRDFALATARQPALDQGLYRTGADRERFIEVHQRAVEIALARPRQPAGVVSHCVPGVKNDGKRVIADGALKLALLEPFVAAIEVRSGGQGARRLLYRSDGDSLLSQRR